LPFSEPCPSYQKPYCIVSGYSLTISYARVGDKIEVTINSSANIDLIYIWEMISDFEYISFQTETPCSTIFLTNQSSVNASVTFGLSSGIYNLKNYDLNIDKSVTIPNRFDCEMSRDYTYFVQSGGATLHTLNYGNSLNELSVTAYFNDNDLFIQIAQVGFETLGLLFSIDGVNYQSESFFEDLDSGTYTLYIKDIYGCQKTFIVINNGESNGNITTPYSDISESNSLRFVRRVNRENCGNYKNQFNTLSCEENVQIPNQFIQLFQSCDIIKTQVKTSYQNVEVGAGNTEIIAEKILANIGLEDKRDCTYYSYNNQLAILFTTGNTYNYDTTDINGTYELNAVAGEKIPVGSVSKSSAQCLTR